MDVELTPDQPKFCPHCHGEVSPLTAGVMATHDLRLPPRPIDPVRTWERAMGWGMVMPAVLVAMSAVVGYCAEHRSLENGPIGVKSAALLIGGATLLLGLAAMKSIVHIRRRGTRYLSYESALKQWQEAMESFERLRICAACQVIVDGKESFPSGALQERLEGGAVANQAFTRPQTCVRTH